MAADKQNVDQVIAMVSDESKQRELIVEDEEEDFMDEGISIFQTDFKHPRSSSTLIVNF